MDSVGAGVMMDPRLIEKTKAVQGRAGICTTREARTECKRVRLTIKYTGVKQGLQRFLNRAMSKRIK